MTMSDHTVHLVAYRPIQIIRLFMHYYFEFNTIAQKNRILETHRGNQPRLEWNYPDDLCKMA